MKKMFMMALAVLAISFASCTNGAKSTEATEDTTAADTTVVEEVVDTLNVDTVAVVEEEVAL